MIAGNWFFGVLRVVEVAVVASPLVLIQQEELRGQ